MHWTKNMYVTKQKFPEIMQIVSEPNKIIWFAQQVLGPQIQKKDWFLFCYNFSENQKTGKVMRRSSEFWVYKVS